MKSYSVKGEQGTRRGQNSMNQGVGHHLKELSRIESYDYRTYSRGPSVGAKAGDLRSVGSKMSLNRHRKSKNRDFHQKGDRQNSR